MCLTHDHQVALEPAVEIEVTGLDDERPSMLAAII
jgi:hypothetical protein